MSKFLSKVHLPGSDVEKGLQFLFFSSSTMIWACTLYTSTAKLYMGDWRYTQVYIHFQRTRHRVFYTHTHTKAYTNVTVFFFINIFIGSQVLVNSCQNEPHNLNILYCISLTNYQTSPGNANPVWIGLKMHQHFYHITLYITYITAHTSWLLALHYCISRFLCTNMCTIHFLKLW